MIGILGTADASSPTQTGESLPNPDIGRQGDKGRPGSGGRGVGAGLTVAIMQPYFIPYAGYFRLFGASDLFVIYDCVQFPRRGWVHRNKVLTSSGVETWLTLPLQKAPREVLIRDLRFAANAADVMRARLQRLSLRGERKEARDILDALCQVREDPVDYIEKFLKRVVQYLGLRWNVIRSSALEIPPHLRGQERILSILRQQGARRYVNLPGGRALYDPQRFAENGIDLCFLPDYAGPKVSILSRLIVDAPEVLAAEARMSADTDHP